MKTENREIPETLISFKKSFFGTVEGSYFTIRDGTDDAVMILPLETGDVSLKFNGIVNELGLEPDDHDSKTLDTIAEALKYVRGIRAGDPVPSELLSGEASWDVSDKDRTTAHNKVTMQLVSWMSGEETLVGEPDKLAQIIEDPKTRERINLAFGEAAKTLGLGKDKVKDVVTLVGTLAEELSYIETLRSKFHKVEEIYENVLKLERNYQAESSAMETIIAVKRLFIIGLGGFRKSFQEIDAKTGETIAVLKNIASQTVFIRTTRDDLHRRLWAWEMLIEGWSKVIIQPTQKNDQLLYELYHFLAQRFLESQEWKLFTKQYGGIDKLSTQKFW